MRAWDSVTNGGSLRPGPAALTILLIGLLLSLAPVSHRLESTYYDFLAALHRSPGSSDVVLVDTASLGEQPGKSLWESDRFPDLLDSLHHAGARLVIPAEPTPLTAALADPAQLASLAEIEQRSRPSGSGKTALKAESFRQQLAAMRRNSELYARIIQSGNTMRNLVVSVPTLDGGQAPASSFSTCQKHIFSQADSGPDDASATRRVRGIAPPPDSLCQSVLAAGHLGFWADDDNVVRRADLLINASGLLVPATAFRAVHVLSFPSGAPAEITKAAISWDSQAVRTTGGPGILLRFYTDPLPEHGFASIAARDLLDNGPAAQQVRGRIVVLGSTQATENAPGYQTPLGSHMSAAALTATTISNLLLQDYLVRPAWLGWLETAILLLMGSGALLLGPRLAPALAFMAGLVAAVILLATEAYLVMSLGIWTELATAAVFSALAPAAARFLHGYKPRAQATAATPAVAPRAVSPMSPEDELDLAFSQLRHQPPTDNVKRRLYDVALEHARLHDLAKAERVLRHLAGIDPNYRNAGEKLKKLAGLRKAVPASSPDAPAARTPPVVTPVAQAENLSGQSIARYQIEQPIGRGAMATVYLGRDPKINRRVAIKTIALAEEFSDSDLDNARTQFLREAESAGRLNHPNIISIYDAGEDGPIAYLAMEYFPGKPLSYYAQPEQMLPPRKVLEIMAWAAEALHYAHGQHVVHRDVKPANMLYDSETDVLKITDFGIARLTDSSRTKTGIILGTPSYMSPEQLSGTNVTGQSDLFSLGVTLYQLLAGVPPFRADTIPKLMQKIAHEAHPPLSEVRQDLPACVDEFLNRALAKDPADRFQNGRSMALALRDCCSSFDVSSAVA